MYLFHIFFIQSSVDGYLNWLHSLIIANSDWINMGHTCFLFLQQIQSNFIVVIHPGSTTLRIGRATDTLPASIPHVIARRHKQQGQPLYKDSWLLREGLNVGQTQRSWGENSRWFTCLGTKVCMRISNKHLCNFTVF
jgi:hypothetical protein